MDRHDHEWQSAYEAQCLGSPQPIYCQYVSVGNVGNFTSGINHGTHHQSAGGISLIRIMYDYFFTPSPSGVEGENVAASGDMLDNTQDTEVQIFPIEDHREPPARPFGPPPYEIYVHTLLAAGRGLPCWEPRPSQPKMQPNGVVPGDVGTYTPEDGFRIIFNLFDDHDKLIHKTTNADSGYKNLKREITTCPDKMQKGETLVRGAFTNKLPYPSPRADLMYEFHRDCPAPSGAILALTSSADKEEIVDIDAVEDYIKRHAEAIYRHAISMRAIGEKHSLYIITGCIKSDTWAMAAYDAHAGPRRSTLRLVPVHGVKDEEAPKYEWRSQGTSEARVGRSVNNRVKDQSLFLRGFKVAFSPHFRSRVKASISQDDDAEAPGPADSDRPQDRYGPLDKGPRPGGKDRKFGGGGGGRTAPVRQSGAHSHAISIGSLEPPADDLATPPIYTPRLAHSSLTSGNTDMRLADDASNIRCTAYHPSDLINAHLLRETGCEIAICHDDSWRFLFRSCHPLVTEEAVEVKDLPARIGDSGNRSIGIQGDVVFLLPMDHKSPPPETARGNPRPPLGGSKPPLEKPKPASPPNPKTTPNMSKPPENRLMVVPDFSPSGVVEKRRSYESPRSAHEPKPPWNCSTPTLPCVTDAILKFRETDVVILVMGMTGSGRSTFINALVPRELPRMRVGDSGSLEAATTAVDHEILDEATLKASLGFTTSYRIVLVDTPGFNSSRKSDSGVLQDIAEWSEKWMPPGGCRGGIVILHDITSHSNERLSNANLSALRTCFNMVIATSKWRYESQDKAQKIHDALARKWEKPSKKASFHRFKESMDAPDILKDLLTHVEKANTRVNFGAIFDAMAREQQRQEVKREQGWTAFFSSLAFWRR